MGFYEDSTQQMDQILKLMQNYPSLQTSYNDTKTSEENYEKRIFPCILIGLLIIILLVAASAVIFHARYPLGYAPRFSLHDYNFFNLPVTVSSGNVGELKSMDELRSKTQQVWSEEIGTDLGRALDTDQMEVFYDPDTDCWLVTCTQLLIPDLCAAYPYLIVHSNGEIVSVFIN